MTATPDVPILLLHSSCREGNSGVDSSSYNDNVTTDGDVGIIFGREDLTEQPITCDLLLLPEYQSSEASSNNNLSSIPLSSISTSSLRHEIVHFPQNHINPCGISNVMTLENLPEWWKTGPVLLSLTSCGILYNNNIGDVNSKSASIPPILLLVEPIPSTFVFDFGDKQQTEVDTVVVEEKSNIDDIITIIGSKLAEIVVEFDFTEASRQRDEILLLLEVSDDVPQVEDDKETTETKDESSNDYTEQRHETNSDKGNKDESLYHDSPKIEEVFPKRPFDTHDNRNDFEDRKLLLMQLNARMESDARTMDRLLRTCGFVSLSLMVMLLWAIYQYYRSSVKSDAFSKEVRESSKKSREVLHEAIDGLHQYHQHHQQQQQPLKLDVLFKDTITRNKQARITEDVPTVKPLGKFGTANNRHTSEDNIPTSFETIPSTPVRNRNNTDIHHKDVSPIDKDDDDDKCEKKITDSRPSKAQRVTEESCTTTDSDTPMPNRGGAIWDKLAKEKDRRTKLRAKLSNNDFGFSTTTGTTTRTEAQENTTENDSPIDSSNKSVSTSVQLPKHSSTPQQKSEKNENKVESKNNVSNTEDGKSPRSIACPSQLLQLSSSPNRQGKKKLFFHGKSSRSNNNPVDRSPTRLDLSSEKVVHILSPCSQLAKEWNEGKTIRRSNLAKKRRPLLQPGKILQSLASTTTATTTIIPSSNIRGSNIESPLLSQGPPPSPQTGRTKTKNIHHHQNQQCVISGPPKLRSVVARKNKDGEEVFLSSTIIDKNDTSLPNSDNDSIQNSNSTTDSDKEFKFIRTTNVQKTPPPIPSLIQETPHLCYTPASEDDSFVDDYW